MSFNGVRRKIETVANFCCNIIKDKDRSLARELKEKCQVGAQSGALLLGIKKPVVIAHGNASADVVENAILFAHKSV